MGSKVSVKLAREHAEKLRDFLGSSKEKKLTHQVAQEISRSLDVALFPSEDTIRREMSRICERIDGLDGFNSYNEETGAWEIMAEVGKHLALIVREDYGWTIHLSNEAHHEVAIIGNLLGEDVPGLVEVLGIAYDSDYILDYLDDKGKPGAFDNKGRTFIGIEPAYCYSKRLTHLCAILGEEYEIASYQKKNLIFKEVANGCCALIYEDGENYRIEFREAFGKEINEVYLADVPAISVGYLVDRLPAYLYPNGCVM